jgi:hypothetical protein
MIRNAPELGTIWAQEPRRTLLEGPNRGTLHTPGTPSRARLPRDVTPLAGRLHTAQRRLSECKPDESRPN